MRLATNPTTASTMIARSSQVRATERCDGVSIAEVVIDDMAIGNPVSSAAQLALLGLIPGIHIAQFRFQVIGNCGVISLMQRSNGGFVGYVRVAGRLGGNNSRNCRLARCII